jgi:hypothetical protein
MFLWKLTPKEFFLRRREHSQASAQVWLKGQFHPSTFQNVHSSSFVGGLILTQLNFLPNSIHQMGFNRLSKTRLCQYVIVT